MSTWRLNNSSTNDYFKLTCFKQLDTDYGDKIHTQRKSLQGNNKKDVLWLLKAFSTRESVINNQIQARSVTTLVTHTVADVTSGIYTRKDTNIACAL